MIVMGNIGALLSLIEWRDEVKTKKKARAIQRVIDKKYSQMSREEQKTFWHNWYCTAQRLSAW